VRYAQGGGLNAAARTRREQVRIAAVEFIAAGESDEQVAARFRVTKMSANRWRRAFQAGGIPALTSKGAAGNRPLLTEDQRRDLLELIEQGPGAHGYLDQRWTLARIRALIRERFAVDYHSSGGLHEMLTRLGISWQVPTRRAVERNEEAIAAWREETWPDIKGRPRNAARTSASRTKPAKG
jgi:transposase